MQQPDDIRLHHLVDAASKAVAYANNHSRGDLETDEMLRLALTKLVEIVGEAAKQVTDETRSQYKEIPWSSAARMRDRLVHHYFDIDLDILWTTVTVELPKLLVILHAKTSST